MKEFVNMPDSKFVSSQKHKFNNFMSVHHELVNCDKYTFKPASTRQSFFNVYIIPLLNDIIPYIFTEGWCHVNIKL